MDVEEIEADCHPPRHSESDSDEDCGPKCISLLSSLLTTPQHRAKQLIEEEEFGEDEVFDSPPELAEPVVFRQIQQLHIETNSYLEEQTERGEEQCMVDSATGVRHRPALPPKPPLDTIRYSMTHVQESSDWQLDALLEELSALETQLNGSTGDQLLLGIPSVGAAQHKRTDAPSTISPPQSHADYAQIRKPPPVVTQLTASHPSSCSSPDGDSAFCDSSSAAGSSSSAEGRGRLRDSHVSSDSLHTPSPTQTDCSSSSRPPMTEEEAKAARIREALEKMREANIAKILMKFFVEDGEPLQLLVDERWTVAETMRQLCVKFHLTLLEDHTIVEEHPELYIRRLYEDHEMLVENIQLWVADSPNKLYFVRRPDKYAFMDKPETYLVTERTADLEVPEGNAWTIPVKQQFVRDFFSRETVAPPDMEGFLWLKADGKKSWKKQWFVLRPSGLYYSPKGKKTTKDLSCLMNLHTSQVYTGINWAKKYKAPTEYCLSIKLTALQMKRSQYIKYICAEDEVQLRKWLVALRIAKNGRHLYDNYCAACERRRVQLGGSRPDVSSVSRAESIMGMGLRGGGSSCSSSQHDLVSTYSGRAPSVADFLASSQHPSPARSVDARPDVIDGFTGTIKRAPADVVRRCSQASRVEEAEEEDSDEECFPPPPPMMVEARLATAASPVPPPKPAFNPVAPVVAPAASPVCSGPPPPPVRTTPVAPSTPAKRPPPPPPKRSEGTRVQGGGTGGHMSDLEAALARRREKIGGI